MPNKNTIATLLLFLLAQTTTRAADETIESLKLQIDSLSEKVRSLEQKVQLTNPPPTRKAEASPRLVAGADGFMFQSGDADTNFFLRLKGYVQADARFYIDDRIPANDTFLMRRIRPYFEGRIWKNYDFRILLDIGTGTTSSSQNNGFLQDAYLNVHYWDEFQIQAGKFKPPTGLERLQSGGNLPFVERGLPTQLTPNRDVGLMLHGQILSGLLAYQAGVFNGVQDNTSGDSDVGTDDHKDLAGRVFAQPFLKTGISPLRGLGIGVAGTYGNQAGALPSYKTLGQQTFFAYVTGAGTNANVSADGRHWRLIPQGYWYWGPLGLFGEYAISSQKVRRDAGGGPALFATPRNKAWQVAGTWFVTGEQNSYSPVKPLHPFDLENGGWGALEVGLRYGELTMDETLFGAPSFATAASANKIRSWGAVLNWLLNKNVKVSLDYDQTDFRGGSGAAHQVTAQDEKVIFTRFQVSF